MPVKSKYPAEPKERATRTAAGTRRDAATRKGAYRRIGEQLGINPEALRNWVQRGETVHGLRLGTTTDEATRLTDLERNVGELRRANTPLRQASAFFAAELDRPSR